MGQGDPAVDRRPSRVITDLLAETCRIDPTCFGLLEDRMATIHVVIPELEIPNTCQSVDDDDCITTEYDMSEMIRQSIQTIVDVHERDTIKCELPPDGVDVDFSELTDDRVEYSIGQPSPSWVTRTLDVVLPPWETDTWIRVGICTAALVAGMVLGVIGRVL